ncbi:MAG: hypothetical protein ACREUV_07375 [Burkholderiales bacterium]
MMINAKLNPARSTARNTYQHVKIEMALAGVKLIKHKRQAI